MEKLFGDDAGVSEEGETVVKYVGVVKSGAEGRWWNGEVTVGLHRRASQGG
jgi:hypothetical protein